MGIFDDKPRINAKTFQQPLWKLAETMSQKVKREGPAYLGAPSYISDDLHMMLRHAMATYNLLFYLNADERRTEDCYWNPSYGAVTFPLVRSMIDCLYNVTAILENPQDRGAAYRKSGLKKRLQDIESDEKHYGGSGGWDDHLRLQKKALDILIRGSGFQEKEVRSADDWPTIGKYIWSEPASENKTFLKTFTYLSWRQYSALGHGAFEGYIGEPPVGVYFVTDSFEHEQRPLIEEGYAMFLTRHIGRAATVLLSIVTELQLRIGFEGANINERIIAMWQALVGLFEAQELYAQRYMGLMKAKGILHDE